MQITLNIFTIAYPRIKYELLRIVGGQHTTGSRIEQNLFLLSCYATALGFLPKGFYDKCTKIVCSAYL